MVLVRTTFNRELIDKCHVVDLHRTVDEEFLGFELIVPLNSHKHVRTLHVPLNFPNV